MKNSRSLIKRLMLLATVAVIVCSCLASCGGKTTVKTLDGDVELHDKSGISQATLNKIAELMLNNSDVYEGIVAAYRGYNIIDPGFEVVMGQKYDAKPDKEVRIELLDADKKVVLDGEGNPTYVVEKDAEGNDKVDENGDPVYATEKIPDVNLVGAAAVIAAKDSTIDTSMLDEYDVINLVKKLQTEVEYDTEVKGFDKVMLGIGKFLGWLTKYIGFGNYLLGICVFAVIIEILMLPLGIYRQKNSIKQAKLRPKEMAIRKRYAGRTDQATQQKLQAEIQEMYKTENFNPASGCLPLFLQLPIILVLYNIVVDPIKNVLGIAGNMSSALQAYYSASPLAGGYGGALAGRSTGSIEALSKIGELSTENLEGIKSFLYFTNGEGVFEKLMDIHADIPSFNIGNINFGLVPSFKEFGWLLLVPVLTFAVYFASSKLTRKFSYQPVAADDKQMGCSNKMMDFMMPAMSVYFTFMVPAIIGVYWIFKSILSTATQFILSKVMPLPVFTDEDIKAAEKEMAGKAPKQAERAPRDPNAPKVRSLHHIDDEDYDERGNYNPVEHTEETKPEAEAPKSIFDSFAPMKGENGERKPLFGSLFGKKKDKKSEEEKPAEGNNEENK